MTSKPSQPQAESSFLTNFLSGGIAGVTAKTIAAPIERVKILMQTSHANPDLKVQYKSIADCISQVYHKEGVLAFWRGNGVNCIRYFPTQALNFSFKDYFRTIFNPYDPKTQSTKFFIGNILAGGFAGAAGSLFVYPLDFARTRLSTDIGDHNERKFKGLGDVLTKVYKQDGIKGLYRGFWSGFVGIFLYRGFYFGLYDTGKDLILQENAPRWEKFIFATGTVILSEGLSYPTDTVKRRLMLQSGRAEADRKYTGVVDCIQKILKEEGVKGFWKGNLSNVYRAFGSSLCLVFYDDLKKYLAEKKF